jgi:hypothetical protein
LSEKTKELSVGVKCFLKGTILAVNLSSALISINKISTLGVFMSAQEKAFFQELLRRSLTDTETAIISARECVADGGLSEVASLIVKAKEGVDRGDVEYVSNVIGSAVLAMKKIG